MLKNKNIQRTLFNKIAKGWVFLGGGGIILLSAFSASYYIFKMPIYIGHTTQQMPPDSVKKFILIMYFGFVTFFLAGLLAFFYARKIQEKN